MKQWENRVNRILFLKLPYGNETPNSAYNSLAKVTHTAKEVGKWNLTVCLNGVEPEIFSDDLLGRPQRDMTLVFQMRKLRLGEVFNTC